MANSSRDRMPPLAAAAEDLLRRARILRQAAPQTGQAAAWRPLAGTHIALFTADQTSRAARLFDAAAGELGAQVAHIDDRVRGLVDADLRKIGAWLGQLYAAIECQGVPAALVTQLQVAAAIPVFAGLAADDHPTAHLADLLEGGAQDPANRKYVLQAALLAALY